MRILYIEDDPIIAELVKRACREFDVGVVTSLAGARYCLSQTHFDILLVDLNLPDSKGMDTVESLRPYCLPIVVLTGDKTPEYEQRCLDIGINDFMVKTDIVKLDFATRIKAVFNRHAVKWSRGCDLALMDFDAIKPFICTAGAFATLALATIPHR